MATKVAALLCHGGVVASLAARSQEAPSPHPCSHRMEVAGAQELALETTL